MVRKAVFGASSIEVDNQDRSLVSTLLICAFKNLMLICHCRQVSDRQIAASARSGATTVGRVGKSCGAGTECGGCVPAIRQLIDEVNQELVYQRSHFSADERNLPIAAE